MFKILIDNKEFKVYRSFTFKKSFKSITSTLSINVGNVVDLEGGESIQLILNNRSLLKGYIDYYSIKYGNEIVTNIEARDNTSDIVDSSMRAINRPANYNFLALIKELTGLNAINKTTVNMQIPTVVNSSLGMNLFDFLNKIAKQLGVFLQADGNGNINIVNNSVKTALSSIDNWDSYTVSNDISRCFNRYTCYTQTENKNPTIHSGQAVDSSIRDTRFMVFESEFPIKTSKQAKTFAEQKKSLAISNSRYFDVSIPFKEDSNLIYEVGSTYLFQKEVVFLDEIQYTINNNEKMINLKLVNGSVYQ